MKLYYIENVPTFWRENKILLFLGDAGILNHQDSFWLLEKSNQEEKTTLFQRTCRSNCSVLAHSEKAKKIIKIHIKTFLFNFTRKSCSSFEWTNFYTSQVGHSPTHKSFFLHLCTLHPHTHTNTCRRSSPDHFIPPAWSRLAGAEDEEEGDGHPAAAKTVDREEEKDSGNAANWFELVRSFVGPSNQ